MHPDVSKTLFEEEISLWPSDLAKAYDWILHSVAYPLIDCEFIRADRTPLRVKLLCDEWDDLPPSISLLNSDGEFLTTLQPNPTGVFNPSAHDRTGRPFVCSPGSREFHTHPGHLNEPWAQFKGKPDFSLGAILIKLWRAWLKGSG